MTAGEQITLQSFAQNAKQLLVFIFQVAIQLPKPKEEGILEKGLVDPGVNGLGVLVTR